MLQPTHVNHLIAQVRMCIQNEAQQGPAFSLDATARKWAIAKPGHEQAARLAPNL